MLFQPLSPLEVMSLANLERVHTSILAWILGADSPIPLRQRADLFAALGGGAAVPDPVALSSVTEKDSIDLVATLERPGGRQLLAIEAKLRSKEHSKQLAKYDEVLSRVGDAVCAKVFLTLDGTPPESSPSWRAVSYVDLEVMLRRAYAASGVTNVYVADFLQMLQRLVTLLSGLGTPDYDSIYFGETAADPIDAPGLARYVDSMKCGKTLQECWMRKLFRETVALLPRGLPPHWRCEVTETHGQALLDILNTALHPGYAIGLQVQHDAVKLFCCPYPPHESDDAQTARADQLLREVMAAAGVKGKPTKPRSRGFTSVRVASSPKNRDLHAWARCVSDALAVVLGAAG